MNIKDCTKLFADFNIDEPTEMDCGLAKKYFEDHDKIFGAWIRGEDFSESENETAVEIVFDNQNNEIHLHESYNTQHVLQWAETPEAEKRTILNKIATILEAKTGLISQIEYCIRGILPQYTKKDLKVVIEYFRYYSDLIHVEHEDIDPSNLGGSAVLIDDTTPLVYFGMVAPAALASGKSLRLLMTQHSAALGILLGEICSEAGLWPGVLDVYPMMERIINTLEMQSLQGCEKIFLPYQIRQGSAMVVFDSGDIDSAVDTVTDAAWSHSGFLPWALKRILIQESVYEEFVQKLSVTISKFQWSLPDDFKPNSTIQKMIETANEILHTSSEQEIRHIAMHESFEAPADEESREQMFKPLILMDNVSPYFWQDYMKKRFPVPVITVQAFRTTKEAISILKSIPHCGLSLWCDRISISNEMSNHIDINNIWMNSFGYLKPDSSFKIKSKPFSIYGGKHGLFWQMIPAMRDTPLTLEIEKRSGPSNFIGESFETCMEKATKLQAGWAQCYKEKRVSILTRIATFLENKREDYISLQNEVFQSNTELFTESFNEAIDYLYFAVSICENSKDEFILRNDKKTTVNTLQPVGVVAIEENFNAINHFTYSVVAATIFGNSVIYTTTNKLISQACNDFLVNGLPVVSYSGMKIPDAPVYESLYGCWTLYHDSFDPVCNNNTMLKSWVQHLNSFVTNKDSLEMHFCNKKTIWTTYGETFAN